MKLVETGSFPIADIEVGTRLRTVDEQFATGLAAILKQEGLRNPVEVMRVNNSFRLVAGAHRLRACVINGDTDVLTKVYEPETDNPELEIRLHEITENVARRELSALDRASHIAELKSTYLELYGEKRGGDRKSDKSKLQTLQFWSLGDEVASKMGLSQRTIFADASLYQALSPATRKRVAGTDLAENRAQLVVLSKLEAKDQLAVLDLLFTKSDAAPPNVNSAIALHFNQVDTTSPDEKAVNGFKKLWAKASKKARKQIIAIITKEQGV